MSDWYDVGGVPATGANLSSSAMRGELALIETAMAKLPVITGNNSKIVAINSGATALESISSLTVGQGGTGATTLTDGGVLLGSGTGAITAMSVLADSEMIVGDGTTDPVAESGATLRTSIGVGTGDNVTHTAITATGLFTGVDLTATTARTTTDMVTLTGDTLTTGNLIKATNTISGSSLANRSAGNNLVDIDISRTDTRTSGTTADDFDLMSLKRTNIMNGAGGTLTAAGSVLKLENVRTQTAGTNTDTTDVLELVQDTGSTGGALKIDGTMFIKEQATAQTDVAGYGQDWVETLTPNLRRFTDDTGTDHILNTTLATEKASTSGTAIDFTGIPAGVKKITIMFVGVSTDGSEQFLIQLGDSGGIETASYVSQAVKITTTVNYEGDTAGFMLNSTGAAATPYTGVIELFLENAAAFTWVMSSKIGHGSAADQHHVAIGSKSLSTELTQLRITTDGTPDDFDAGVINIQYG